MDTIDIDESMEDLPEMNQDTKTMMQQNPQPSSPSKLGGLAGGPPKIAIPSLNLSSLKHVKEYTS